jgi:hypothetical protein
MNPSKSSTTSGTKFGQHMVNQTPRFEKTVYSRAAGIYRPTKKKKKARYL